MTTRKINITGFICCLLCLAIGIGGVFVGWRSWETLKQYEATIKELEIENKALKELRQNTDNVVRHELSIHLAKSDKSTAPIRNRNLLNIKRLSNGQEWEGQIGVDRQGHVIFSHEAYSVRAGAIVLNNYENKHGINTVRKLIARFCESNRDEYVRFLCHRLKVKPDEKISLTARLPELLKAMIKFETGLDVGSDAVDLVASMQHK